MGRPTELLNPHTARNRRRWQERLDWLRAYRKTHKRDRVGEYSARDHLREREYFKNWLQALRLRAFQALGGPKCKQCGFTDLRALQFDHINGGEGRKDRARFTTPKFYRHVIKEGGDKFQVLCANCNTIKKLVNREFGKHLEN